MLVFLLNQNPEGLFTGGTIARSLVESCRAIPNTIADITLLDALLEETSAVYHAIRTTVHSSDGTKQSYENQRTHDVP